MLVWPAKGNPTENEGAGAVSPLYAVAFRVLLMFSRFFLQVNRLLATKPALQNLFPFKRCVCDHGPEHVCPPPMPAKGIANAKLWRPVRDL